MELDILVLANIFLQAIYNIKPFTDETSIHDTGYDITRLVRVLFIGNTQSTQNERKIQAPKTVTIIGLNE